MRAGRAQGLGRWGQSPFHLPADILVPAVVILAVVTARMDPGQSRQERRDGGCSWLCTCRRRDGYRVPGTGREGWAAGTGHAGGHCRVPTVAGGVCLLPGEEVGAETQAGTGWTLPGGMSTWLGAGVAWAVLGMGRSGVGSSGCGQEWRGQFQCPSRGRAAHGLRLLQPGSPGPPRQVHRAGASRAAESARAGAAAAADDLQICSGAIPAVCPRCGSAATLTALQAGDGSCQRIPAAPAVPPQRKSATHTIK